MIDIPARDLTGNKFGRLTVLYRVSDSIAPSGYKTVIWRCRCDCGNEVIVRGKCLTGGVSKSCGCFAKELMSQRTSKHNGFGTRLYSVWNSMRQRCNNPKHHAYQNYGGRGISICNAWNDFAVFRDWALSTGYAEDAARGKFTLDRIDVDGNYTPENCRWADMRTQTNNRRETVHVTYMSETHPLTEWANITGIKYHTLWSRYKRGLSPEMILSPID